MTSTQIDIDKNKYKNDNVKDIDILKKTYNPNYVGDWTGGTEQKSLFLNLYIKKKYKNDLFFIDYMRLQTGYYPGVIPKHILLIDLRKASNNNFHKITKKNVQNELSYYINLYKKSKKRFNFFEISMVFVDPITKKSEAHSTSAMYDSYIHQVDFFNTVQSGYTNLQSYHRQFKIFFQAIYGENVVLNYSQLCILFGQKEFEEKCLEYFKEAIPKFTITGTCAVWTLWFLDMRLQHKEMSREKIIDKALKIFLSNKKLICKIIIDYAVFVDKLTKNFTLHISNKKNKVLIKKKNVIKN